MTTEFKRGDKVTVTLDGTVTGIIPFDDRVELRVTDDSGNTYYIVPGLKNVTKVEPPVEVFGPGDVVQNRRTGERVALGREGYIWLATGNQWNYRPERTLASFTSDRYERVSFE